MTPDTTPGDLVGTVREVQADLRERYNASEVKIDADDWTEWERRPGGREMVDREEQLTVTLTWGRGDIPGGDPERSPVLQHLDHTVDVLEELTDDFPGADVSTYANRDHARVNLTFEDEP